MVANVANVLAAYAKTAASGAKPGMDARETDGPSFGEVLEDSVRSSIDVAKQGEKVSAAAVVGKADLTDVVTAVSNAEVTVQTVVAVRDKVVAAYQEIMRMPI